jgi:hypothetical protein
MTARFARRVPFGVASLLLRAVLNPVPFLLADVAGVVVTAVEMKEPYISPAFHCFLMPLRRRCDASAKTRRQKE